MDNPQAFPTFIHPQSRDGRGMEGMTLRDYFAGQALNGFCALDDGGGGPIMGAADTAKAAYNYADAMLAARGQS